MKHFLRVFLILGIIGAGIAIHIYLAEAKETPERSPQKDTSTVVEVVPASSSNEKVSIVTMGVVMPSRSVTIIPEISGKVSFCSKKLIPGGRFRKGETILRMSSRQYDLALEQQRAAVAGSEMELSLEFGRKAVADKEWMLLRNEIEPTEEGKRLALREIQLGAAKAAVAAAKSNLELAEMNRDRTIIKAPYNAVVTEKSISVGQVVGPGSRLATLVDADTYWVGASVPIHQLPWIQFPQNSTDSGSKALIKQEINDLFTTTYAGEVIKLQGGVDQRGQMSQLLIEVKNPLQPISISSGLSGTSEATEDERLRSFPLLLDAAVSIEIEGPELAGSIEIPRHALRKNNTVWVLTDERKLAKKKVSLLWTRGQQAFVRGELLAGDNVVVSRIDTPVAGMKLKLEGEQSSGMAVEADAGMESAR